MNWQINNKNSYLFLTRDCLKQFFVLFAMARFVIVGKKGLKFIFDVSPFEKRKIYKGITSHEENTE